MLNKQIFTIIIGSLLALFIFIPVTLADSEQTYTVGVEVLVIKDEPAQDAETIGQLVRGNKVTIFQEKYGWAQTYVNEQKVWVASQYLIPIKEDTNQQEQIAESHKKEKKQTTADDETQQSLAKIFKHENVLTTSLTINADKPLSGYHITIDPGHGGNDPGAIGVGHAKEKKLTLATAKEVSEKLRDEGATVTLTRSDDTYIPLKKRVQISNAHKTDAFISLHYNAYPKPAVNGISTFYKPDADNKELAMSIQKSLMESVKTNNRGAKEADYFVLRENRDTAALVELGFITNSKELKKIKSAEYQEKVANGITDGLKSYFNQ